MCKIIVFLIKYQYSNIFLAKINCIYSVYVNYYIYICINK